MSLEAAITELNKNLLKNNELLEAANIRGAKALTAIDKVAGATAGAGKADKGAPKEVSADDLKAAFGKYLETDDAAELAKRKTFVKEILAKLDAPSVLKISSAEDRGKAAEWLAARVKSKKFELPTDEPADDGDGDGDDDMLG